MRFDMHGIAIKRVIIMEIHEYFDDCDVIHWNYDVTAIANDCIQWLIDHDVSDEIVVDRFIDGIDADDFTEILQCHDIRSCNEETV